MFMLLSHKFFHKNRRFTLEMGSYFWCRCSSQCCRSRNLEHRGLELLLSCAFLLKFSESLRYNWQLLLPRKESTSLILPRLGIVSFNNGFVFFPPHNVAVKHGAVRYWLCYPLHGSCLTDLDELSTHNAVFLSWNAATTRHSSELGGCSPNNAGGGIMSLDYQLPTKHSRIDAVCLTWDNLLCQTQTALRLSFIVEFVFELPD